jgi:hypothetical protein
MTYDGALVMPRNCVAMTEEEMVYVEGGKKPNTGSKMQHTMSLSDLLNVASLGQYFR